MLLEKWLMPDAVLPDYGSVTPELLRERGVRALICDIDNTLATYDDLDAPEALRAWVERMAAEGIAVAVSSNNRRERVSRFAGGLGIPYVYNAGKPSPRSLNALMEVLGTAPSETAVLGDQLLTDVWSARRAGLYTYVVPPIKDRTEWFFRMKRKIERPYMEKYRRLHAAEKGRTET